MIPIPIEPSLLAYGTYSLLRSEKSQETTLRHFCVMLDNALNQLERDELAVAMTPELYNLVMGQIPWAMKAINDHGVNIAVELLTRKLPKVLRRCPLDGRYGCDVELSPFSALPELLDDNSDELYRSWFKLLGLIIAGTLPPVIIKSSNATRFPDQSAHIKEKTSGNQVVVSVSSLPLERYAEQLLAMWRLAYRCLTGIRPSLFKCSGTGTHSSIWGKRIQTLNDLPSEVRSFVSRLYNLGVVTEITFSDYYERRSTPQQPFLELHGIESCGNKIKGLLVARGEKQNAQTVYICCHNHPLTLIIDAFGKEIRNKEIDELDEAIKLLRNLSQNKVNDELKQKLG